MKSMRSLSSAAILALPALAAACSFAPDYVVPTLTTPAAYKEAGDWKQGQPGDDQPKGEWWKRFQEPELDQMEAALPTANQSLKAAVARFDQARAAARYARADYYPQVTVDASGSRAQRSKTVANPIHPRDYSDHLVAADLSYEIDVWGRVRNQAAAGEDAAQASAADLGSLQLSLSAELAADYFMIRGYDAQQRVLDQAVEAYQRGYEFALNRYKGGAAAAIDVAQAEAQLRTAQTLARDTHLKRAQLEHAIAIITGVPPAAFSLAPKSLDAAPLAVAPGLPSTLLERRPDIAAAERRVASANAEIGVARAAYYPTFSLSALFGFESADPSKWIGAPSALWSLGPALAFTAFDGGRRDATTDQARARYDETVADYRQTVLDAYQEVEDNLVALTSLADEAQSQAAAVDANNRVLNQAELRYKGGLATYLEVVSAENATLNAQLSAIDILTRRMTASVTLVKALGGGWDPKAGMALDTAAADPKP